MSNLFAGIARGSASPVRGRRSTQNGRSPLTLSSEEQSRHAKYAGGQASKVAATQSDIKSPPIGGNFTHASAPGGVSVFYISQLKTVVWIYWLLPWYFQWMVQRNATL